MLGRDLPTTDGKSRGATGGLNSSEAWFIYLTFRYRDWGAFTFSESESDS